MILVGLVLSGLAMGLASPSYATTIGWLPSTRATSVIANAMGTTMMNIGMLTGIQTMFVVLGDGRQPDDFAVVFAFGAVVTAFGLIGGLMVTSSPHDDRNAVTGLAAGRSAPGVRRIGHGRPSPTAAGG